MKYKIIVAYEGTNYSGWQIQPHSTSIQQILENSLKILLKNQIRVIGSGRTDKGVHALGQVAHFEYDGKIDFFRFLLSLNAILPLDIKVKSIEEVPEDFHAQYSPKSKEYHYHIHLDRVLDPFKRRFSFHVHSQVDLNLLKEAAKLFVGTHDFTSFANQRHHEKELNPVRTLFRVDINHEEGGVRLEFEGDGFLYKMVRNIVGTLVAVSKGKCSLDEVKNIFLAKDRRMAPQTAPAHGLFLVKVNYE